MLDLTTISSDVSVPLPSRDPSPEKILSAFGPMMLAAHISISARLWQQNPTQQRLEP